MEQNNNYTIIVNLDLLFDFKAVLFCLTRNFNEKFDLQKSLSQSYMNNIQFKNFDELADSLQINDKFRGPFISFIEENDLYSSIKPRLIFCYELYYLIKIFTNYKKHFRLLAVHDVMDKSYLKYIINTINEIKKLLCIEDIEIISIDELKNIDIINCDYIIYDERIYHYINSEINKVYIYVKKSEINNKFTNSVLLNSFEDLILNLFFDIIDKEKIVKELKSSIENEFVYKYKKDYNYHFLTLWVNNILLQNEIIIESNIISGFKRGSKLLGVPTANLNISDEIKLNIKDLVNGVYFGKFRFLSNTLNNPQVNLSHEYNSVLSIGYNPYFDNLSKTIEVFLIDYEGDDFYGEEVKLTIIGYLRSEAAFENFSELVTAITYDIIISEKLLKN